MFIQDTQLFLYLPEGKRVLQPFLPNKVREVKLEKHKKNLNQITHPPDFRGDIGFVIDTEKEIQFCLEFAMVQPNNNNV